MPGLTLAHLLSTTVVVADVWHAVDNLFAIKLKDNTESTVRRRVVRTEVEEHEVLVVGTALHAPVFRFEGQRLHLQILLGFGQLKRIEFGSACRVVFTQRVAGPGLRHHDARQVWVAVEGHAEHFPGFTLVPVGVREKFGDRRQMHVVFRQCHLEHDIRITVY